MARGDTTEESAGPGSSGRSAGDLARLVPAAILLIVLVVFALANTDDTEVDLLVTDTEAPLIVVLLATAVVGALIASLLRFRRRRRY